MAKLVEHMPRYYYESNVIKDLTLPIDNENTVLCNLIVDNTNQYLINKATFSLEKYESEFGLPVNPEGITILERQSRLISKLRGTGTATKEFIKLIVESWSGFKCDVIEKGNYIIEIAFTDQNGIPSNMPDVYARLEEVKPAHLEFRYTFKYNTHKTLSQFTYSKLSNYTQKELAESNIS